MKFKFYINPVSGNIVECKVLIRIWHTCEAVVGPCKERYNTHDGCLKSILNPLGYTLQGHPTKPLCRHSNILSHGKEILKEFRCLEGARRLLLCVVLLWLSISSALYTGELCWRYGLIFLIIWVGFHWVVVALAVPGPRTVVQGILRACKNPWHWTWEFVWIL